MNRSALVSGGTSRSTDGEGCWEWKGAKWGRGGYGLAVLAGTVRLLAHRAAWMLTRGPIPAGECVLHSCDNPPCVRPSHLFLGTRRDNTRDMVRKGRAASGGPRRALPPETVEAIREMVAAGHSQFATARHFRVHQTTVNKITLGARH